MYHFFLNLVLGICFDLKKEKGDTTSLNEMKILIQMKVCLPLERSDKLLTCEMMWYTFSGTPWQGKLLKILHKRYSLNFGSLKF